MSSVQNHLIVIGGPTAVGKTAISLRLANYFKCPILSADSRQFYQGMNIGTAKPSDEELQSAEHYFINHLSVEDSYSVGDFERDAIAKLNEIYLEKNVVILTGGTGLYIRAVLNGLDDFPKVEDGLKKELNLQLENEGIVSLQSELEKSDPDYYQIVDRHNPHRLIRALSIFRSTGKPFSHFLKSNSTQRNFHPIRILLSRPREELYQRINERVEIMMSSGLLEEVQNLKQYRDLNALNTVGYSELFKYLEGEWKLDFAIEKIKQYTRNYAKRQMTWFRNQGNWNTFHPDDIGGILELINTSIQKSE